MTEKKILVVDDEDSIRRTLEGVFRDEGFRVFSSKNGEDAVRLVQEEKPDLVLLDIWLPGMDGLEALQEFKKIRPELPVIMISGHATIPTAIQATKLGAVDFIEKPLDLEVMLTAVKKALGLISPARENTAADVHGNGTDQLFFDDNADYGKLQREYFFSDSWRGAKLPQRTLAKSTVLYGHGVHSGRKSGLLLEPLPVGSGIHFAALSDAVPVPAHINFVDSTQWATTVKIGSSQTSTIEHLLAALHAYGISNLLVKCNGEVPVMDGSAEEFCRLIEQVGLEEQGGEWYALRVPKVYRVGEGREYLQIEPAEEFSVDYTLEYPEPVGKQHLVFSLTGPEAFKREIAPARTFGFVKDIGALQKAGLALGGRFDNFVLIGADGAINAKLRFPDEAVRHKVLDIIGDLYLLGRRLTGKVTACMTGHSDNVKLLRLLWAEMQKEHSR